MAAQESFHYHGWKVWQNKFRWQARHVKTGEWLPLPKNMEVVAIKSLLDDPVRRKQLHEKNEAFLAKAPAEIAELTIQARLAPIIQKFGKERVISAAQSFS